MGATPVGATPVIALVGRPNVGKSTLFNRLTRSRDALVADIPGLTRDRRYGDGVVGGFPYIVIDTGGLQDLENPLGGDVGRQAWQAVDEADLVLFLVDGRSGPTADDDDILRALRGRKAPTLLVVNKIDGIGEDRAVADYYSFGLGEPVPIAAAQNRGMSHLLATVADALAVTPLAEGEPREAAAARPKRRGPPRIAIIGRPNVGKSTLINQLIGEERLVASDIAGTTRDSITVPFDRGGRRYDLIDTAGVRRRGKVRDVVEKFSVVKTLQSVDACEVAVVLIDATEGLTEQDLHVLGYAFDAGRAMVLGVNKSDTLDKAARDGLKAELARRLGFARFATTHFISASKGTGLGQLLRAIDRAYASATTDLATPQLTRLLEHAVTQHQPPLVHGRRIKLRYAHQGGSNPPVIVVHGKQVTQVPAAYRRYLANFFIEHLMLEGTPLRIEFQGGDNPFAHRATGGGPAPVKSRKRPGKGAGSRQQRR
ncbi:MAG: ribosome biogenesis GTPase Der [Pseudomonadota bacterium]